MSHINYIIYVVCDSVWYRDVKLSSLILSKINRLTAGEKRRRDMD